MNIEELESIVLPGNHQVVRRKLDDFIANNEGELKGRALIRRAELEMILHDYPAAIDDIQGVSELTEDDKYHLKALLISARLLVRTMNREGAKKLLEDIEQFEPEDLDLFMAKGELELDLGLLDEAKIKFQSAFKLAEAPSVLHERLQAAFSLAVIEQLSHDPVAALPWLKEARNLAKTCSDSALEAQALFSLGSINYANNQKAEAITYFDESLKIGLVPAFQPVAYILQAEVAFESEQSKEALDLAINAAKASAAVGNPSLFVSATILASKAQKQMGRFDDAKELISVGAKVLEREGHTEHAKALLALE